MNSDIIYPVNKQKEDTYDDQLLPLSPSERSSCGTTDSESESEYSDLEQARITATEESDLETPSEISVDSVDQLVRQWCYGSEEESKQALDELVTQLNLDIHRRAKWVVKNDRFKGSMQPTALMNELYIVYARYKFPNIDTKDKFLNLTTRKLGHSYLDYVRQNLRRVQYQVSLDQVVNELSRIGSKDKSLDINILFIDSLLERLWKVDPKQHFIVTQKYIMGRTTKEIAEILDIKTYQVDYQADRGVQWLEAMSLDQKSKSKRHQPRK